MAKCISQYEITLDQHLVVSFSLNNCFVETIPAIDEENDVIDNGSLRITIPFNSKSYESLSDAPIFTRAKFLSILGVISYLVDYPFEVFAERIRTMVVENDWEMTLQNSLTIDTSDCSDKLQELLDKIESSQPYEQELTFSLLDRWRKARFMENETEDSLLYNDEATLSYFHVLELIGNIESKELTIKSKKMLENFCLKYNEEILSQSGKALKSEAAGKVKLLSSVLEKDISVYAKISYFLKKHDLFEPRTACWIKSLIEARNSVAHGRRVFYDKAIFPVQPFFPLTSSEMYPLTFLRILTGKVIAVHIGISSYDEDWCDILKYLNYGDQLTKEFLSEGNFQVPALLHDEQRSIVFGGINDLILSNKIKLSSCIDFFRFYINCDDTTDFNLSNIHALIMLLESTDEQELNEQLTDAIVNLNSGDDSPEIKFRDLIYYFDFHGISTKKLENLVATDTVR